MNFSDLLTNLSNLIEPQTYDVTITAPISENAQAIQPGGIFLARQGDRVDGHDLIPLAIEHGAVAVVGERSADDVTCSVAYAQVADGRTALGPLAAAYYGFPSQKLTVIGVTGTDGKTTVCTLIYNILKEAGISAGMISTVKADVGDEILATGLHVTTPPAHDVQGYLARMVEAGLTHVVLETTSHGLAQDRVNGVDFDVAVITNVTHEHLDFHGSWTQYRHDKARLFELTATSFRKPGVPKIAVINTDDPSADLFCQKANGVDRIVTYGLGPIYPRDVHAEKIQYSLNSTYLFVIWSDGLKIPVISSLVGSFNVLNMIAAIAVCRALLDHSPDRLRAAIFNGLHDVAIPGRMELIDEGQDFLAMVDFAHTPNSLKHALEAARGLIAADRRIIAVFGSAGLRDREKRRMMAEFGAELADIVILTAEDPRTESLAMILNEMTQGCINQGGVEGETFWRVMDRGQALAFGCSLARQGDLVIVFGKGHEQSMCFGTTEYPWDDREALRAALQGAPLQTLPTANLTPGQWNT